MSKIKNADKWKNMEAHINKRASEINKQKVSRHWWGIPDNDFDQLKWSYASNKAEMELFYDFIADLEESDMTDGAKFRLIAGAVEFGFDIIEGVASINNKK